MILDLKSIFAAEGSAKQIDYEFDMSDTEFSGVFPLKTPVSVSGRVSNSAGVVSLLLDIRYVYSAPCDRCGEFAERGHNVILDKMLAVSIEGEDSDTIITVPNMKLDVDELVYSEVVLDIPYKHLCNEECKGICSVCGKNLNREKCTCEKKEIDPRLAKLAELLDN
ncbi:MAG: DUF177 domain-containing protein [Clostridia bacterium]|nr:DUF177 domain-containing protein [Clostridia bacterium]